jgi:phosphoglycolate phosphatase
MMNWKAVLFDMDGTVLDTLDDLTDAVNRSLAEFSLPTVDACVVRRNLGSGAAFLIAHCVPSDCSEELCERVLAFYKPWYDAHCRIHTRPYDGIPELLQALKSQGHILAVASNKYQAATEKIVAHFFPGIFDVVLGERENVPRKPDPQIVYDILRSGVTTSDIKTILYIGDSLVDAETAKAAEIPFVACTWGFCTMEQLSAAQPDHMVHHPLDILSLLA